MAATYQVNVNSTLTTAYGLIQSFTVTNSGDVLEAKDANGAVADVQTVNEILEASAEFVQDTTQALPGFGDSATVTGDYAGVYLITSVAVTESNGDYKKLSVTIKRYVDNSLPSA